jgi:hypothetical protein
MGAHQMRKNPAAVGPTRIQLKMLLHGQNSVCRQWRCQKFIQRDQAHLKRDAKESSLWTTGKNYYFTPRNRKCVSNRSSC